MADRFQIVSATLSAELAKPYVYGESDCFFLGCRMADALNPALNLTERYWHAYSTLTGAQRALRRHGFMSVTKLFNSYLEPCAPAEAQLGDIAVLKVVLDGCEGEHVAICLGTRFATRTETGRLDLAVTDAIAAFRTGARP